MRFAPAIRRIVQFIRKGDPIYFGFLNEGGEYGDFGNLPCVYAITSFGKVVILLDEDIEVCNTWCDGKGLQALLRGVKEVFAEISDVWSLKLDSGAVHSLAILPCERKFEDRFVPVTAGTVPLQSLEPALTWPSFLQVIHAASFLKEGPLRPWVGYVACESRYVEAGDEVQHARSGPHAFLPATTDRFIYAAEAFAKWPKKGDVFAYFDRFASSEGARAIFRVEDEIRIVEAQPITQFWPPEIMVANTHHLGDWNKYEVAVSEILDIVKALAALKERSVYVQCASGMVSIHGKQSYKHVKAVMVFCDVGDNLVVQVDTKRLLAALQSIPYASICICWPTGGGSIGPLRLWKPGKYTEDLYPLIEVSVSGHNPHAQLEALS